MPSLKDLTGRKFGMLTVLERTPHDSPSFRNRCVKWTCRCDCGIIKDIAGRNLSGGGTISCGCSRTKDLSGKRFGRLVVLSRDEDYIDANTGHRRTRWNCVCDCGNNHSVFASNLRNRNHSCGSCSRADDLTNQRFGRLVVIARGADAIDPKTGDKYVKWNCVCDCGTETSVRTNSLKRTTRSCGCLRVEKCFKGFQTLSGQYIHQAETRANTKGMAFNIDAEYCYQLYVAQSEQCALSGVPLTLQRNFSKHSKEQSASIDRINSGEGYVKGNIQWVHKRINAMKLDMSDEEFIGWCRLVVAHNTKTNYDRTHRQWSGGVA